MIYIISALLLIIVLQLGAIYGKIKYLDALSRSNNKDTETIIGRLAATIVNRIEEFHNSYLEDSESRKEKTKDQNLK